MSDLTYRLIVDLSTTGSLEPGLGRIGKAGEAADGMMGRLRSTIGGLAGSVGGLANAFTAVGDKVVDIGVGLGKMGAVVATGAIAYGVAHLNSELESTRISLAGIFSAQGVTGGITQGLELSRDVMKDMRRDANELPGEFKDLVNIFRFSATPGFQAGASVDQLEKLSAHAMATAAALQVPMDQAAREMGMLLQGRAGAHNVLGNLLGLSGGKAEAFNKSTGADRLKTVEAELQKYAGLNDAFAVSFDAISSTLKDNAKQFGTMVTSGLFERIKILGSQANSWFDQNHERVEAFGAVLSDKLVYAFELGRAKILDWLPAFQSFATNAKAEVERIWSGVEPILARIEPVAKRVLADPSLFSYLKMAAGLYGALKVGGAVAPIVGPAVSGIMKGAGGLGEMAGLGGAAAGGGLVGAIAVAAAAVDIAGFFVALGGAMHILGDETNWLHNTAVSLSDAIKDSLGASLTSFGATLERLAPLFVLIADTAGLNLLTGLEGLSLVLRGVAAAADTATAAFAKYWNESIAPIIGFATHKDWTLHPGGGGTRSEQQKLYADAYYDGGLRLANDQRTKPGAGGGGGGTHIARVEITVASNQDPNRIARLTVERLAEISRNPTRSPSGSSLLRRGTL